MHVEQIGDDIKETAFWLFTNFFVSSEDSGPYHYFADTQQFRISFSDFTSKHLGVRIEILDDEKLLKYVMSENEYHQLHLDFGNVLLAYLRQDFKQRQKEAG